MPPGDRATAICWTISELGAKLAIVAGKNMMACAKMMGMTPETLTFSGMCVVCPP